MLIDRELLYAGGLAVDCPVCGTAQPAEAPECLEGHGTDCPDRVCLRCGTAVFVNPDVMHPDTSDARRSARASGRVA
jgi:hypothetical protein